MVDSDSLRGDLDRLVSPRLRRSLLLPSLLSWARSARIPSSVFLLFSDRWSSPGRVSSSRGSSFPATVGAAVECSSSPTYIFSLIFQGQLHHQFSLFNHLSIELGSRQECQVAHEPSENFPHQDDHHCVKYTEELPEDALRDIFAIHSCHRCGKADEDTFEPKTFGEINCCGQPQSPNGKILKYHWLRSYPLWGFKMNFFFTHLTWIPQKLHPPSCNQIPRLCGTRPWYNFDSSMVFSLGPGKIQVPPFPLSTALDGLREGFYFSRTVLLGNMTVMILYPQNFQSWWTFIPKMNPFLVLSYPFWTYYRVLGYPLVLLLQGDLLVQGCFSSPETVL